jgi:hypothetical protein
MATVRDLINASFRLIGVTSSGETAKADELTDALSSLNRMIARWSNERLFVYARVRETFPLVAAQASYTMGVGGNFNTSRPMRIDAAAILDDITELPIDIISQNEWAAIVQKTMQSPIPVKLHAEATTTQATLRMWPVPSEVKTLVLYSWKPISSFSAAGDTVSFPPGYEDAIVYCLAVRLAPEYGRSVDPGILMEMTEAKANIKRMNIQPQYLSIDLAITGRGKFNIFTGE